jgi:polysaccharide export outer membrane protein
MTITDRVRSCMGIAPRATACHRFPTSGRILRPGAFRTHDRAMSDSVRTLLMLSLVAIQLSVGLTGCSSGANPRLPAQSKELLQEEVFVANEKAEAFSTADMIALFDAAPPPTYQIGPGDRLNIDVWERPELSGEHVVGPDGYISLPVAGPLKLSGLGREESHAQVKSALSQFYDAPIVTIAIEDYVSNNILVLGRVTNPGTIQFVEPPTLLDAIALAGGLPVGGQGSEKATLTRCAIFRGRDRLVWLPLKDLLSGRNLSLNLQLRAGDMLYIPDSDDQLVYALGEVNNPGAYNLSPEMTLMDVIARAGGLTRDGDPRRLRLVRPSEGASMKLTLTELLRPNPRLNVSLQQGDILYVPSSELGRIGYVMDRLNPLTSFLVFTQTFGQGSN